jgi:hypothetical protein
MYHEILSLKAEDGVNQERRREAIRIIALEYLKHRAEKNIAFGGLHEDHEGHIHYHLMISANAIGSSKKTRLSKAEFAQLKANTEAFVLTNYPELKQSLVMGRADDYRSTTSDKETQVKKRGRQSKVEQISEAVGSILRLSATLEEFQKALARVGLEYYIRSNTAGVIDQGDGTKYRFNRLGLEEELLTLRERSERQARQEVKKEEKRQEPRQEERKQEAKQEERKPTPEKIKTNTKTEELSEREKIAQSRQDEIRQRRESEEREQSDQHSQTRK